MSRVGAVAEHLAQHRALARLNAALDEELGTHHGIDWTAFALLDLLQSAGGCMAARRAAECQGLTPTRLLLQVLPLEKLGLVGRSRDSAGVRQLAIAAGGRRVLREAQETAHATLTAAQHAARR